MVVFQTKFLLLAPLGAPCDATQQVCPFFLNQSKSMKTNANQCKSKQIKANQCNLRSVFSASSTRRVELKLHSKTFSPEEVKQPLDLENAKLIIERRWQVVLEVVILGICRVCHYFPASIQILFTDAQLFLV